jgi:hypothetical protein
MIVCGTRSVLASAGSDIMPSWTEAALTLTPHPAPHSNREPPTHSIHHPSSVECCQPQLSHIAQVSFPLFAIVAGWPQATASCHHHFIAPKHPSIHPLGSLTRASHAHHSLACAVGPRATADPPPCCGAAPPPAWHAPPPRPRCRPLPAAERTPPAQGPAAQPAPPPAARRPVRRGTQPAMATIGRWVEGGQLWPTLRTAALPWALSCKMRGASIVESLHS